MARVSNQKIIDLLLETHDPIVRQAFLEAVSDLRNGVSLTVIAERLDRGDVLGAIEALNIEPEAFSRVQTAILEAYNAGGQSIVGNMPRLRAPDGSQIVLRWGVRDLPAEQEMRRHAAQAVTGVSDDMKEGLREVLTQGLARGDNPRATARRVVGQRSRASNQRVGGLVGLTSQQMQTVERIRVAMETGDTAYLRQYLGFANRDKRFDRTILKAIREGVPVPTDKAQRAVTQYENRALDYRGKVISRHETLTALHKSRYDAFEQQIASGKLDVEDIEKTWKHTARENPRVQHVAMHGQTVRFDQPFIAPDGTRIRYPLDPEAPARHTLGCLCRSEFEIDFAAAAVRRYRGRIAT